MKQKESFYGVRITCRNCMFGKVLIKLKSKMLSANQLTGLFVQEYLLNSPVVRILDYQSRGLALKTTESQWVLQWVAPCSTQFFILLRYIKRVPGTPLGNSMLKVNCFIVVVFKQGLPIHEKGLRSSFWKRKIGSWIIMIF